MIIKAIIYLLPVVSDTRGFGHARGNASNFHKAESGEKCWFYDCGPGLVCQQEHDSWKRCGVAKEAAAPAVSQQIQVQFNTTSRNQPDNYSGIYSQLQCNGGAIQCLSTVKSAWKKSDSEIYLYSQEHDVPTESHYLYITERSPGQPIALGESSFIFSTQVVDGAASGWKDAELKSVDIMFRDASPGAKPTYERIYDSKCVTKTDQYEGPFEDKSRSQCKSVCSRRGGLCYGYSWRTNKYEIDGTNDIKTTTQCLIWLEKVDRTLPVDSPHRGTYVADRGFTCDVRISYKWW
jgi:hypothetical protein